MKLTLPVKKTDKTESKSHYTKILTCHSRKIMATRHRCQTLIYIQIFCAC